MTTAIYPNRLEDKERVERIWGWDEMGNDTTEFRLRSGTLLAVGYNRIVYGDHGPYVEFQPKHIAIRCVRKFNGPEKPGIYYRWCYPAHHPGVKVYYRLRDVKNMPNAPKRQDGKPHQFNRPIGEGYADYRVGCIYLAPEEFI